MDNMTRKTSLVFTAIIFLLTDEVFAETAQELYQQGQKFYDEGKNEKAIEYLEKSTKLDPNFAPAFNTLGLAYQGTNVGPKEVIWYFKTAVEIDPKFVEAYDNLGKAYYGLGRFDKAEEYCKRALEISPNYTPVQFSLAWIYLLGISKPQDAIYYFKKVIERKEIPNAYFGLGMAYFMVDNRAMVLDIITKLRSLNEEKLAEELENMVRDYYYIQGEEGGSLVKIEPPPEVLDEPAFKGPPVTQAAPPEGGGFGGVTKIRMSGTFFNIDEEEMSEEKTKTPPKPATVTTSKGSSLVHSSPSVQPQKNPPQHTTVISPSKATSTGSKKMIEVFGSPESGGY
jgi:lipoprotein NlpI